MKRFDTNIRALDGSLQETPEIFHAVRVNDAINVGFGVVHNLVGILIKTVIGLQRIRVQRRSSFYVVAHDGLKVTLAPRANVVSANLASLAFEQSEHNRLAYRAALPSLKFAGLVICVHEPSRTPNEGFIGLNGSSHLVNRAGVHGV